METLAFPIPSLGSSRTQLHASLPTTRSAQDASSVASGEVRQLKTAGLNACKPHKPGRRRKVRLPLDLDLEEQTLPVTTRLALENKGIYGWWATESPSPSPGPITFTDPQRRLVKRADREKEVERRPESHEEPYKNDHEALAKILRGEEKLKGHRCYCDAADGHEKTGTLSLLEFEKPILLITSLFRLAARTGSEIELIAFPADMRRVILRSRLSWYIFGLQSEAKQTATNTIVFRPNAEFNPFEPPKMALSKNNGGLLAVCKDWSRAALTAAAQLRGWARRVVIPINELPEPPPLGREVTSQSNLATKGSISERSARPQPGAFWSKCRSAWSTLKEAAAWFAEEDIWVPETEQPDEKSKLKLEAIFRDLRALESRLLAKSFGRSSSLLLTLSDVCFLLIPHLSSTLISDASKAKIARTVENDVSCDLTKTLTYRMTAGNIMMRDAAISGLLGINIQRLGQTNLESMIKTPQILYQMPEPPRCSVVDILDPLSTQTAKRLVRFREGLDLDKFEALKREEERILDRDDNDEVTPWWLEGDSERRRRYREHLMESKEELARIESALRDVHEGRQLRDGGFNWSTREYMTDDRADFSDTKWSPAKPQRLQEDLYGASPGAIENIFDPAQLRRGDSAALTRPRRALGQSQIDLFKRVADSGKGNTLFGSKSLEEFLTSTDGFDAELTDALRETTTFTEQSSGTGSDSRYASTTRSSSSTS